MFTLSSGRLLRPFPKIMGDIEGGADLDILQITNSYLTRLTLRLPMRWPHKDAQKAFRDTG